MAHEIYTAKNGQASMAFVGATPWHGLGQHLTEGAPITIWTQEAGFDWEALAATPTFTRADGTIGQFGEKSVIYRSDTGAPLSVMGDRYKIVQPREVLGFFDSLIKDQGFQLHTAGVLCGGNKLWALAKNGHGGEVVKGDKVRQFLMLSTSLDGSSPTTAAFTEVRIVCANTLRMAMRSLDKKNSVRVSHRSVFDANSVKEQLGLAGDVWRHFMDSAQALADKPCNLEEAREILRGIFGQPVSSRRLVDAAEVVQATPLPVTLDASQSFAALLDRPARAQVVDMPAIGTGKGEFAALLACGAMREQKSVARSLELFDGAGRGADHPGVKGTRWGLLNAITEHVDHEMGRTVDSRLDSAWFGRGDAFKQSAFAALTA